jgi:hypothetical protein
VNQIARLIVPPGVIPAAVVHALVPAGATSYCFAWAVPRANTITSQKIINNFFISLLSLITKPHLLRISI